MSAPKVCECCKRPLPTVYEEAAETARLSPKQRDLFLAVARRSGHSVEHGLIHEALWGDDPNGGPEGARNVVAVMVRNVNAKLAAVGYRIDNSWGIGYRLTTIFAEVVA